MGNNFKFYSENYIDHNATYVFTSSDQTLSNYLYDNNYNTQLQSVGSDDLTPEVYIITFAVAKTFDSLFIGYHNGDTFTIDYSDDNQGSWTDFSTPISETGNSDNYNFYTFTEVSGVTDLRVTINTTMTADDEKLLGQLRAFSLLGEVTVNPYNMENPFIEDSIVHPRINTYVQFDRTMDMTLDFDSAGVADVNLFRTLKDRYQSFYVQPNGGLSTYTQEPFRTQDIYLVNYINEYHPRIRQGFLVGAGSEITLQLRGVG